MPSWSNQLAGLRAAAWDELSALGARLATRVSPETSRRVRYYVDLAQRPRAPLVHVTGDEPGKALDHVGHDKHLRHAFATRLGTAHESTRATLLRSSLSPSSIRALSSAPIVIVELERDRVEPFARDGWLVLPRWVKLGVDLRHSDRELWDAKKRETVAKIDRSPLDAEIVAADTVCEELYARFYAPTAHARHGALAYVRGRRFIERIARGARVLFVRDRGERVAAVLLAPRDEVLDALVVGVRGGEYDGTTLAREAVYLFAIRHARVSGHRALGLTSANPFLDDGLLRFKKRWGAEASMTGADGRVVAMALVDATEPLITALSASPIVHLIDPSGTPRLTATTIGDAVRTARPPRGIDGARCLAGEGATLVEAFRARARACVEAA